MDVKKRRFFLHRSSSSSISHANTASSHELILNSVFSHHNAGAFSPEVNESRARDVKMISSGDESSNFPSHPSINLDHQENRPGSLLGSQAGGELRGDGNGVAGNEGRPNVDLFVTLVRWRDGGAEGDLLVIVSGVNVEAVVVDADPVVGVSRRKSELEVGGEEAGGGGVESVDGGVLEDEPGLAGTKDCPDEENCYEDEQEED
ncbi:hypothetical protein V6N13_048836 [Hibiscus sabdariffa]|uniref:Uncharacterized protein n=1 Tax=Hibiscus sabdariffa TaxID=183260 RepID=A0ABR2DIF2_9ROSI